MRTTLPLLTLTVLWPRPSPAQVRFQESFEDTSLSARGWYDGTGVTLSTTEHIPGSTASFECRYLPGATSCAGGVPGRRLFAQAPSVYLSYWVKYSPSWQGTNRAYHPHEFLFLSNANGPWDGPAYTRLTLYVEQNEGRPLLALQDGQNVDLGCVLRNDDSFVGCNGSFSTYPFTENRSVASCNGLAGELDGRDCFPWGSGYYSARTWRASDVYFSDNLGPTHKSSWHFVEAYFELNSVSGGRGVADGKLRYWYDGQLLIASDQVLFRTAQHPGLEINQFLLLPYMGDGSPVDQTMWVDDLTVAVQRPTSSAQPPAAPANLRLR